MQASRQPAGAGRASQVTRTLDGCFAQEDSNMKVINVLIENFRAIRKQSFTVKELSIFIGNNGTGKTSVLEAINFALSPYFISGRIKHTDFNNGTDSPIIIEVEFDTCFNIEIPDGYATQKIPCNKIHLEIKKRDKSTPGKAFSDGFVVSHYAIPFGPEKTEKGWVIKRSSGTPFKFSEYHLEATSMKSEEIPRCFYFNKNREQQLKKGYNSSISSVFDDFNWRFLKGLRKINTEDSSETFIDKKNSLEKEIIEKVDNSIVNKVFLTLNEKLRNFELSDSKLSFIDGNAPFDSAFLSRTIGNLDIAIPALGSGIEIIISLLFLETLASLSKENIIIIIDEPELHLHPYLQEKLIQYLKDLSKDKQILLSTHSPYFFKNCSANDIVELLITTVDNDECLIRAASIELKNFPWSPSWGEINYFAYNLPTIEFHDELYGYIQEKNNISHISDLELFFESNGIVKCKKWIKEVNGVPKSPEDVTLMTYIRNFIHHPENGSNLAYSFEDLKTSIDTMIAILK